MASTSTSRRTPCCRLVFCDDDYSVTAIIETMLVKAGYDVTVCLDPLDALAQCEVSRVNVFISDFMMPGFTGLEVLEVLRQKYPTVVRVLLTAAPQEPEVREAMASGLVEHLLEKPWGRSELLRVVQAACAASQALR